ncbi:MAG: acetolactate synthase large subunit [Parasphingorhabdus sp.]
MNGAESLIGSLVSSGVDVCFTNPGTSEMHFVAALDKVPEMKAVLVLFEGVATGAADGYARMADKPAATLLHLGPGLANGLANLHNAKKAHSPVVNIIGDHATYHQPFETPLASDVKAIAAPVSHWVRSSPNGAAVGHDTVEAVNAAMSNGGQIASLILPADTAWTSASGIGTFRLAQAPALPPDDAINTAAKMLKSGKKTAILMGGKANRAEGKEAASRIAEKSDCLVFADTFNARMENGAGRHHIARMPYFAEQIVASLEGVEQIILAGSQTPVSFFAYPDLPNYLVPEGCSVHVLASPNEDGVGALEVLADAIDAPPSIVEISELKLPELKSGDANALAVWAAIANFMPENAIIVDEAATSGAPSEAILATAPAHDLLQLTGGSIGMGLPVSLGAAMACPDRKIVCAHGDGGAMYTAQALWSQAREDCDVVNIIFNNRKYQILEIEIMRVGAAEVGPQALDMFDLSRPEIDWIKLSESMGVQALRAQSAEEINRAVEQCMQSKGPHLIEVII